MPLLLHRNLVGVTIVLSLQNFAVSLVNVFVPLLLLNHGIGVEGICLYYLGYATCKIIVDFPALKVIQYFGVRVGYGIALCTSAVYLLSLSLMSDDFQVWTPIASAAAALTNAFLWNGQHFHLARVMESTRRGANLAIIESAGRLVTMSAPVIGGVVLAAGGQRALLLCAVAITLIALVPTRYIYVGDRATLDQGKLRFRSMYAPKRHLVANFCYNAHALTGMMIWPAYLALAIADFADIGLISTITAFFSMAVLWVAGRRGDAGNNRRVLTEATVFVSLSHCSRLSAVNPLTSTLVGVGAYIAGNYQQVPWTSMYYAQARKGGSNYIMAMEFAGDVAYVTMWLLLLGMSRALRNDYLAFNSIFVLTSLLSLGVLWIGSTARKKIA